MEEVIVSTPYRYAEEMLAEGRAYWQTSAILPPWKLASSNYSDDPTLVKEMENRTLELGRTMLWSEIAKTYAAIFQEKIRDFRVS